MTWCHGPAGAPRLATRCLCVLSTWLVVCLVPCAPMSIVCPLPSCYLIIVSVAPAVSPSLPSFVSLYSLLVSAVLCWSVVFHVSMSCELNVWLCSSLLPACLFFPFGVVYVLLFHFIIKTLISSAFESSTSSLVTERISQDEDSAEEGFGPPTTRHYLQPPIPTHPPVWGPELLPSAGQWCEEVCRRVQRCSWGVRVQRGGPQRPFQQCSGWAPQLVEDEGAGPPEFWAICGVFGTFPSPGGGRRSYSSFSGGRRSCGAPSGGRWSCSAPRDSEAGMQAGWSTYEVGTGSRHVSSELQPGGPGGHGGRHRDHSRVRSTHGVRSRARSVPGAHAVRSVPGAHAVRSVPGAHAVRSAPWAHGVRSRARSDPRAHGVRSRARSDPGAQGVRSRARSDPGAHAFRSDPGAHAFRSGPGAHAFRSGPGAHAFRSGPGAHAFRSGPGAHALRSGPGAHAFRSGPGAHAFRSGPGAHAFRSGPGAHAFRSGPGAHVFRSRARSDPGAQGVRSRARSDPGAHGVRSRARSDPGAQGVRSRARSDPGAHGVRSRARSDPGAQGVRSRARSDPGAHAFRSDPGAHAFRSGPGAHAFRSRARSGLGAHAVHSGPGPSSGLGTHRARSRASPTLAPLCAHCSRPSSTPWAWPTSLLDIFLFSVCGASGIRSLKGGLCHGPAGAPRLATRCLCVLSTWLVVCLVPCAPMSIVCPLPSCYLIIVSVAPAVSPSLPSFVSLYSLLVSAVLCWSVVFHVSMSCELNVWLCSSLLPACLFFPFGVVYVLLFHFIIKTLISSAFESSTSSLVTHE